MYEENSLVGKVLNDRYEILELVGSGGMATVYKAECKLLNRYVAVKVIKDSLRYDLDLKDKFNKEAQAAAKLSHNNIVSIFDVGEVEGLNYIVMEYIDGITLTEYINQNKPINWMIARNIAIQIGLALEHAHSNGIIHRDIKPHNILITKENVIKVADFGIASAVTSDTLDAGQNSGVLGSVRYISPEQARGGFVTETSDLYSLGVIMYEMVTGELPFDGDNPVSIAMRKLEEDPVNCKVINLDIPHDMAELIMRTLSRDSASRYQNAQELLIALKKLGRASGSAARDKEEERLPVKKKRVKKEKIKQDDEENVKTNKILLTTVIAMIIVMLLAGAGTFFYLNGTGVKEVKTPYLIGITLEEALELAEEAGFTVSEKYEFDDEVEEGVIISQTPGANITVKNREKDKVVKVIVSKGKEEGESFELISVEGLDYEDAKEKLEELGLKVKKAEEEDNDEEEGTVLKQEPPAKEKVNKDSTVTLTVCVHGEERTLIPNVIGMTKEDAKIILENAGFKLGNVKKEASDKPEGEIIDQNPTAKSESPKKTNVNIVVSAGKRDNEDITDEPQTGGETQNPESQTQQNPTTEPVPQEKTITIHFPESGNDVIQVKVLANGKEIYNEQHNKSEKKVDIRVSAKKDALVQVYFDDVKVVEKTVEFN